MGPNLAGQRTDLACIVHSHFEYGELAVTRHSGEAEGNASVIVVAFHRAMNLARTVAIERRIERFLGAGLADRTCDSEDRRSAALARCTAERLQGGERVFDQHMRAIHRP